MSHEFRSVMSVTVAGLAGFLAMILTMTSPGTQGFIQALNASEAANGFIFAGGRAMLVALAAYVIVGAILKPRRVRTRRA